jgi:ribosomal protein S18 acetylase RimI-like enzyme
MSWIERPSLSEEVVRLVNEWCCDPSEFFGQKEEFGKLFQSRVFSYPGLPPLFLRDGNDRVAFVFFRPCDSSRSVAISVLVAPDKRGQGYGSQMVKKVKEIAQEQNIERLVAYVRPENEAAVKLFKGTGYKENGVEKIDETVSKTFVKYIFEVKP